MTNTSAHAGFDPDAAHPARRYNYWLGGKDHFEADRASGDAIAKIYPDVVPTARENRAFLKRVVRYLSAEAGIRQFLDIGTGLPTAENTHEIAQHITPAARIVYVDNDPLVLIHARALLTSHPDGITTYLDADLRTPEQILRHPGLAAALDLSQPVALLLVAVLHFLPDTDQPYAIVRRLLDELPPGSYLAATHATYDGMPTDTADELDREGDFTGRTKAEFAAFFDGLTVIDPGIVRASDWRREPGNPAPSAATVAAYAGLGQIS
jgi:hypothetical protein